jgi:glycosyltransferase involved in cell wall biosynthesis
MKLLILYRELAAYTVECINKLAQQAEITLIHYPLNAEAPFQFVIDTRIKRIEKGSVEFEKQLHSTEAYTHVLISGWADQTYNSIAAKQTNAIRIMTFDTAWKNTLKFQLGSLYLRWKLGSKYHYAFIPGQAQWTFAKRLGFKEKHIQIGLYTATDQFKKVNFEPAPSKELWCVARYIPQKNLSLLWEAFSEIAPNNRSGWTLHCAGTGELFEHRTEVDGIIHHGFLQPEELARKTSNASAFILPSIYEPWGVVVHEWAKMGKPMLLSSEVGAAKDLLDEGENGFTFSPFSKSELKAALIQLFNSSDQTLKNMGEKSFELSMKFSSDLWVQHLLSLK